MKALSPLHRTDSRLTSWGKRPGCHADDTPSGCWTDPLRDKGLGKGESGKGRSGPYVRDQRHGRGNAATWMPVLRLPAGLEGGSKCPLGPPG